MECERCNKITAQLYQHLAFICVDPADKTVQLGSWIYEGFFFTSQ